MKQVFECATCGIVTEAATHLCQPVAVEGRADYCGQPVTGKTAMTCAEETRRLDYQCDGCGRTAEAPTLICRPRKV